ncbi:hypothetical protein TraAM80_01088 [Trypanosoma rangeli]|uniref:Uncharacterized protein n=1 Tax=Trypanosoma rangeli TaxID=5698 RepID=A0A3R7KPQ3_TRYRA|nr:uncharacterized protein TraAM80_01088 [Trypanosoma rangeli]RNF11121.1 hypothetical protein TraAM80_01088 [Trypanosoma rangeli]|eukprot:RNF11121.1 hypothetical protein TraAM80_01088 [Trypanosoma rangeli]
MHSAKASFYLAFVSKRWCKGVLRRGWAGQVLLVKSFAIAHKSSLKRALHGVTRCLGDTYSLLDRVTALVSSIEDMLEGERPLSPESGASAPMNLHITMIVAFFQTYTPPWFQP